MIRVGFTGTQEGMSERQMNAVKRQLKNWQFIVYEVHHGDCIGADDEFDEIARSYGFPVNIHPPKNPLKRAYCYEDGDTQWSEKDYMERNQEIVNNSDALIAAPLTDTEYIRSGTWATVRMARKKGIPVILLPR